MPQNHVLYVRVFCALLLEFYIRILKVKFCFVYSQQIVKEFS
jgi:hypothetical protein